MRSKKINRLIMLVVSFTLLPMLIIGFALKREYKDNMIKMANSSMVTETRNNGEKISYYIKNNMENLNEDINFLELEKLLISESDESEIISKLSEKLVSMNNANSGILLFNKSGQLLFNNTSIKDKELNIKDKLEDKFSINEYFIDFINNSNESEQTIIMYKPLYDKEEYIGCVATTINNFYMDEIINFTKTFETENRLIINTDKNVIYNYEKQDLGVLSQIQAFDFSKDEQCDNDMNVLINKSYFEDKKYSIYSYKLEESNLAIISQVEEKDLLAQMKDINVKVFLLIVLANAGLLLIYIGDKKRIDGPLNKLIDTINGITNGDLSLRYEKSNDENIDKVGNAINTLVENLEQDRMEIDRITYTDILTSINNRNKFIIDGNTVLSSGEKEQYSIIKFDIDKFKYINDIHGYDYGDKIVKLISETIKEITSEDEYYARGNDDNFMMLVKETDDKKLIERIDLIIGKFNRFKDQRGRVLTINFSFGIYKIECTDNDFEKIIDKANIAQKSAKMRANHKSTYAFYDYEIKKSMIKEKKIENIMYDALENDEFLVYLQAKNDLDTLKIAGAEALVRWNSSEIGFVSPGDFIPTFEKNGFVVEVDFYVFEQVCKKIRQWLDDGLDAIVISVNQSKRHLEAEDYIDRLVSVIKKYNVPAELIELEITEDTVLDNIDKLINVIDELHQIGFKISIDDFGSGYSSLNLLKQIDADILKIDREFLREVEDSKKSKTIIRHVIEMAKELNIKTITEGVEKQEQAEFLRKMGCDMAQGFLYSKPIPLLEFENTYFYNNKEEKEI